MFDFAANLGTVLGVWTGIIFIAFGILGSIKNQNAIENRVLLRSRLLVLLGIVIILAGVLILSKTFIWLGEVVFSTVDIIILWESSKVEKQLGKITLAVLGLFIVMQPLHYLYLWLLAS